MQVTRPYRQRGVTLLELLAALAVIGAIAGGVAFSFRAVSRATARTDAGRLAAAIRYLYDRAVTTGAYYRLVIDLSANKYWAEKSDERFYLVREKESAPGRGRAPDDAEKERQLVEEEERERQQLSGLAKELLPPPKPKRARFESFKDSTLPTVALKVVHLRDLYTPRQREPYTEGKAYLYFFPDGHTERALIHLSDDDDHVVALRVHPLTGRVEILPGNQRMDRDFDAVDGEGRTEAPR